MAMYDSDSDDEGKIYNVNRNLDKRKPDEINVWADSPLFMTPEDLQKGTYDEHSKHTLDAISALLYDDDPNYVASNFKNQGNQALKRGKKYYSDAIQFYTQGLEQKIDPTSELYTTLLANRAQVHLLSGNNGHALADAEAILQLDPKHMKAFYRGVKAANQLKKWDKACELSEKALQIEPNKEIDAMLKVAKLELQKQKVREDEEQRKKSEAENKEKELVSYLTKAKKWKIGFPEVTSAQWGMYFNAAHTKNDPIYVDGSGEVHFPVLFLYDEMAESDFVVDAAETDHIVDHLGQMFPPHGSPCKWDPSAAKYHLHNLTVFFKVIDQSKGDQYVQIDMNITFQELFALKNYVFPAHLCVLHVVPNNSEIYTKWKTIARHI